MGLIVRLGIKGAGKMSVKHHEFGPLFLLPPTGENLVIFPANLHSFQNAATVKEAGRTVNTVDVPFIPHAATCPYPSADIRLFTLLFKIDRDVCQCHLSTQSLVFCSPTRNLVLGQNPSLVNVLKANSIWTWIQKR